MRRTAGFHLRMLGNSERGQRGAGWGAFLVGIALISMLVGAGLLYIHQITSSAARGYDVFSLERRVGELKEQQQRLELEAAQLQSLKTIEDGVKKFNFVHADNVAFTSPMVEGPVAYSGGATEF